jgi:hypothetical protein
MSLMSQLDATLSHPPRRMAPGRAIGMLGVDIPVELVIATEATPVQLGSNAAIQSDFALADRFLENSFSLQSRIVAQQWLTGDLDPLEAVVFSRSDDSAQRLYYYMCELQRLGECRGPRPVLYDVARIPRDSSLAHTIESTKSLAAELGVRADRLPAAARRVAMRAELLNRLMTLRASDAVPSGSVAHRIFRVARLDWSDELDRSLQTWLAVPNVSRPQRRLLLVGSVPADETLHVALEAEGATVVGEVNEIPPFMASNEQSAISVETIAHRIYHGTRAARALLQSPSDIVKTAQALRVDAVIVWMLATDTGLAWEAPRIDRALREAHFPLLMLTSQPDVWDQEVLAQAAHFVRTVAPR